MPVRTDPRTPIPPLSLLLASAVLLASCGDRPRREEVDGVEYVHNPSAPAEGEVFPEPVPPVDLQVVTSDEGGAPPWTAVREVRAWPGGGWAVLDMHRAEITFLDEEGETVSLLDLSSPPLGLVSPMAFAVDDSSAAVADMALRRVVRFTPGGEFLTAFEVAGGLPADLAGMPGGEWNVLTVARPFAGREQITQVRRYAPDGAPLRVAGQDSLLLEHRGFAEIVRPLPLTLDAGPGGTLYAAGLEYQILQVLPGGERRVLIRPPLVTRVPGYVMEQRRDLMSRRVPAQQRSVPVTEETEVARLTALDDGDLLVQSTDWHPALLDDGYAGRYQVLLLDLFQQDGRWMRRHALRLPLPATTVTLTDAADGWVYGWSKPFSGDRGISVFRFRVENLP
ncbi:MAG: hypothetical protein R6W82_12235 [bacterium]